MDSEKTTRAVVAYGEAVQIGPDDYRMVRTSRVITEQTTIADILKWLESLGVKNPCITSVDFSSLDESDK